MYKLTCPFKYKYELVSWYVNTLGYTRSQGDKLTKRQLYAIWYKNARKEAEKASREYIGSLSKSDRYELKQLIKEEADRRDQIAKYHKETFSDIPECDKPVNMNKQLSLLIDNIWDGKVVL